MVENDLDKILHKRKIPPEPLALAERIIAAAHRQDTNVPRASSRKTGFFAGLWAAPRFAYGFAFLVTLGILLGVAFGPRGTIVNTAPPPSAGYIYAEEGISFDEITFALAEDWLL